ncbi:MAG: carbohydrate kinase [Erysipelotrichaceae bacterium]|nr:carbohydrate kinase [Erysipelotrichaceae bacterium]
MILCVGEILVDMIQKDASTYKCFVGGAPFNVSANIALLGGDTTFCGMVGNDVMGKFCIDEAKKIPSLNTMIKTNNSYNTTLAFVNIIDGERSFSFYRKKTADYLLDDKIIDDAIFSQSKIIHIGSLMLNKKKGNLFVDSLINKAKNHNKLVSFDINYREDIFKKGTASFNNLLYVAKKVDILKLSCDEVSLFSFLAIDEAIRSVFSSSQMVFVTFSDKGSKLYYHNKIYFMPNEITFKPLDSTGAGDSYFAMILTCLDKLDINVISDDDIYLMLKKANLAGGLATQHLGAIDVSYNIDKVLTYLKNE